MDELVCFGTTASELANSLPVHHRILLTAALFIGILLAIRTIRRGDGYGGSLLAI